MKIKPVLFALLLSVILSSCSLVKDQTASNNFRRVKYNAHLKLSKSVSEKQLTVNSFEPEGQQAEVVDQGAKDKNQNSEITNQNSEFNNPQSEFNNHNSEIPNHNSEINNQQSKAQRNLLAAENPIDLKTAHKKQQIIKEVVELTQNLEVKGTVRADDWWESDPEDWPWKQIILGLIAFLLLALLIFLLVDLLGGVVGGIIGLVLLLLLLYFLIDYLG